MHVGVLATNSIMHVHFARVPVMVGILAAGGMCGQARLACRGPAD